MAKRLLLVCEDPADRHTISRFLAESGLPFEITKVNTQREYRVQLAAGGWDLVVSRVKARDDRRDRSALWALEMARAHDPDLPVVLLGAEADLGTAVETMKLGAQDFLPSTAAGLRRLPETLQAAMEGHPREPAETWLEHLLASSPHGVFVARDGRILLANDPLARMLGASVPDLVALTREEVHQLFDFGDHPVYLGHLGAERTDEGLPCRSVVEVRTLAGQRRWLDMAASRVDQDGRPAVLVQCVDLTAQKRTEADLKQTARRLEILNAIDYALLAARSLEEIAQAALGLVSRLIPSRRITLISFEMPTGVGQIVAAHVDGKTRLPVGARLQLNPHWRAAFARGEPVLVPDLMTVKDPPPTLEILREEGIRSTVSIPVRVGEELLGSLNLASAQPRGFSKDALEIAREVANSLAVAMLGARLNASERSVRLSTQALVASARDLSATLDLGRIFDLTLDRLKEVVPYVIANLVLLRESGAELVASRGYTDLLNVKDQRRAVGEVYPLERKAIATQEPCIVDDVRAAEDWVTVEGLEDIRSWMVVPFVIGERVLGCLNLGNDRAEFYTPELAELASAFAAHAATAIHNARLFEAERRLRQQQAALHATALEITIERDLPTLLKTIVERAVQLLEVTSGGLYLCDRERREVRCVVSYNTPEDYTGLVLRYGEGAAGWVAETGEPLVIDDYRTWPGRAVHFEERQPFAAVLSVPMFWHGRVTGVIHALHESPDRRFDSADRDLLIQFASQAAIAVENARLLEAEREARVQADTLRQAIGALTSSLELEKVLDDILIYLEKVLPYESACVFLLEKDALHMVARRGFPEAEDVTGRHLLTEEDQIFQEIQRSGRPIVLEDAPRDPRYKAWGEASHVRGWMGVPLSVRNRVIGMLTLDALEPGRYSEQDGLLAQAFASQAGIAIENARLYGQARRQRARLAQTLRVSETLHRGHGLSQVLEEVAEGVIRLGFRRLAINIRETDGETIRVHKVAGMSEAERELLLGATYLWSDFEALMDERFRLSNSYFVRHGEVVWDRDFEGPFVHSHMADKGLGFWRPEDALLIPLIGRGEEWLGFFSADEPADGRIPDLDTVLTLESLANQAAIAIENTRLFEQIRAGRERLRRLSEQLLNVQEQERRRLSLELHDRIGQSLTAVKISAQGARRSSSSETVGQALDQVVAITERAINQVRDLSLELRPSILDDLGLTAALRWYLDQQAQLAGFNAVLETDLLERRAHPEIETASFRIIQEAVTNVIRHADAENVWVEVRSLDQVLHLTIRDDGRGFDVVKAADRAVRGESVGVLGMEERARLLGGTLELDSSPGQGTVVRVQLPMSPALSLERRAQGRSEDGPD